jgi:DNA polymerase III epsilon subunit-like protein
MLNTNRHVVIVDTETTGLDPRSHVCVEVAWWNLNTRSRGCYVPVHDTQEAVAYADSRSLAINNYVEKIMPRRQDVTGLGSFTLALNLSGAYFAGVNPAFDRDFLIPVFDRSLIDVPPQRNFRLWDISDYASGALGLDYKPGLADMCDRLGVREKPDHSAERDVIATGQCFLELFRRAGLL